MERTIKLVYEHRAKGNEKCCPLVDDDLYFAKPAAREITKYNYAEVKKRTITYLNDTVLPFTVFRMTFPYKGRYISASASIHLQ